MSAVQNVGRIRGVFADSRCVFDRPRREGSKKQGDHKARHDTTLPSREGRTLVGLLRAGACLLLCEGEASLTAAEDTMSWPLSVVHRLHKIYQRSTWPQKLNRAQCNSPRDKINVYKI